MGETSSIQWTDRSWNPWQGCTKISPGCANCYMFRDKRRYGQDPETVVRSKAATFDAPRRWNREAAAAGRRDRVFTCSWSDWFIREADAWRDEAWAIVKECSNLTFQILTKRHGRIAAHMPADWGAGYPNVWLGGSIEDQPAAAQRVPVILSISAKVHFLSVEPMLGPVDMHALPISPVCASCGEQPLASAFTRSERCRCTGTRGKPLAWGNLDWVIYGGESGGFDARVTDPAWIRDGVAQCASANVAAFVKQLGSPWARLSKGRDPHGGDMEEWPADLRVREYPVARVDA